MPNFTYHNKPEQRAAIERDGFITSGDVGHLDADGYLFLCDRKRDMVISGGVNIYPAEIEAVLLRLTSVKDCAVFGIPDAEFGEKLMAVVEPSEGSSLTLTAIQAHLTHHLAGYKVPRIIQIGARSAARGFGQDFQASLARSLLARTRPQDLSRQGAPPARNYQLITRLGSIPGSKPGTWGILKSVAPGQYPMPGETST